MTPVLPATPRRALNICRGCAQTISSNQIAQIFRDLFHQQKPHRLHPAPRLQSLRVHPAHQMIPPRTRVYCPGRGRRTYSYEAGFIAIRTTDRYFWRLVSKLRYAIPLPSTFISIPHTFCKELLLQSKGQSTFVQCRSVDKRWSCSGPVSELRARPRVSNDCTPTSSTLLRSILKFLSTVSDFTTRYQSR